MTAESSDLLGAVPPSGYAYLVPAGWTDLDPHPDRRVASVRAAVRARVRGDPRLGQHLAGLDAWLRAESALAWTAGALRVSLYAEPVRTGVASAALTMSIDCRPPGREPTATVILEELAGSRGALELVELAQVSAVRRTWDDAGGGDFGGGDSGGGPPGRTPAGRHWQLMVPCPGTPAVGLLTLSSASPMLWPTLAGTFAAVAASFHWTWPGEQEATRHPP